MDYSHCHTLVQMEMTASRELFVHQTLTTALQNGFAGSLESNTNTGSGVEVEECNNT